MRNESFYSILKTASSKMFLIKITKFNKKIYFVILLLFLTAVPSFSQSSQKIQVLQKDNFLSTLRTSSVRNSSAYNSVLSLLKDVNSSIYLSNGSSKTFGQLPVCMFTDVASLSTANSTNLNVNYVEIVTIDIKRPSELQAPIDLSLVSSYKNVKYIYFRVSFDFELSQLIQAIKDCNPKVVIFYSIEKIS